MVDLKKIKQVGVLVTDVGNYSSRLQMSASHKNHYHHQLKLLPEYPPVAIDFINQRIEATKRFLFSNAQLHS